MALSFSATTRKTGFLDPFNDFAPKELAIEVRRCPLSGDVARILSFRARPLGPVDHSDILERDQGKCPFCNLEQMGARFLPAQVPEGRLTRGECSLIPNAFPYESMNAVLILGKQHYRRPAQFTPELISEGLLLAREGFARLAGGMRYASVNWNYMMPAGAGIVHPHFQIAAGRGPTRFQAALAVRARAHAKVGGDIAADYLEHERKEGSRWIGRLGPAGWVVPFAPRAIYDVMGLVPGGRSLMELGEAQVQKLAEGVCRVLAFFEQKGVAYFNLGLHTTLNPAGGLPLMIRMVSRINIGPMLVDEINYFEKLHDEMLTFVPPETLAAELRGFWQ